jgi:hypothetical protein
MTMTISVVFLSIICCDALHKVQHNTAHRTFQSFNALRRQASTDDPTFAAVSHDSMIDVAAMLAPVRRFRNYGDQRQKWCNQEFFRGRGVNKFS